MKAIYPTIVKPTQLFLYEISTKTCKVSTFKMVQELQLNVTIHMEIHGTYCK